MKHFPYKKLWVFGDSFANASITAPHWSKFLAKNLQITNDIVSTNLGKPGASLDHLYYEWNRTRHLINGDSLVVICVTQIQRQWFSYPNPTSNGFRDQQLLVDFYDKLWHQDLAVVRLQNFLDAVAYWKSKRNIPTVVILPSFTIPEEISIPSSFIKGTGSLQKTSLKEVFNYEQTMFLDYNEPKEKSSHLIEQNHQILADKISQAIKNNNKELDCTNGFVKDFFNIEDIKQSPRNVPIPTVTNP